MARPLGISPSRNAQTTDHLVSELTSLKGLQLSYSEDQFYSHISRIEPTMNTCGSMTPVKMFHGTQQSEHCLSQRSSDDATTLVQSGALHKPVVTSNRNTPSAPRISASNANIGRRRSQYGSLLLRSPSRPGYASRMQQIFKEADIGSGSRRNAGLAVYPQLPNISRPSSRLPWNRYPKDGLLNTPSCPPTLPSQFDGRPFTIVKPQDTYAVPEPISEGSSGLWSDDSGYINLESRAHGARIAASTCDRIHQWLSTISQMDYHSEGGLCETEVHEATTPQTSVQQQAAGLATAAKSKQNLNNPFLIPQRWSRGQKLIHKTQSLYNPPPNNHGSANEEPILKESTSNANGDNRLHQSLLLQKHISDDYRQEPDFGMVELATNDESERVSLTPVEHCLVYISSPHITQGDGGIELSPLSPNVCIERGPSRHHTTHNTQLNKQLTKTSTRTISYTPPQYRNKVAKENMSMDKDV